MRQINFPGFETLERGGGEGRTCSMDTMEVGKMLFCFWVLCVKDDARIVTHRDEFLSILEYCTGDDMPPALRDVLSDELIRERMVSGIVRGGTGPAHRWRHGWGIVRYRKWH